MKTILLILIILLVGCTTCKEDGFACCKGLDCAEVAVDCIPGHEAVFKGCNDKCVPVWDCVPLEPVSTEITLEDIDLCEEDSDCMIVPYSHCCGATKKGINMAYFDEYIAHPEWQVFDDSEACAVIGKCLDDTAVDNVRCDNHKCILVY